MNSIARVNLRRFVIALAALVLALGLAAAASPAARAATAYGPGNSRWDAYYANPFDSSTWGSFCLGGGAQYLAVDGVPVPACGPTGSTDIDVPLTYPYTAAAETSTAGFQCVELIERYLYVWKHWGAQAGDGADMVRLYANAHKVTPIQNSAGAAPHIGDVLSFSVEPDFTDDGNMFPGHTAIVTASNVNSSGNGTITILSQNWNDTYNSMTLTITDWTVPPIQTDDASGTLVNTPYVEWLPAGRPPAFVRGVPNPGTDTNVTSVACHAVTSCIAVGYDSPLQPMLVTGSVAKWSAAQAPLPSGESYGLLSSVACPSSSACVAAGYAEDNSGDGAQLPTLETGPSTGASWTASAAPLPANAATPAGGQLQSVACYSATSCTAVGFYYTATNASGDGLLVTGAGTSWTPTEAPLPAGAGSDWGLTLDAVACPSATTCVAVGSEDDPASGYGAGLLVTGSKTSWTSTVAPLPANAAADPGAALFAVACHSATSCVAVGQYNDTAGNTDGLLLTLSGTTTTWTPAEAPLPANAAANSGASFGSVACPSATCIATGFYTDTSGKYQGIIEKGSGTAWSPTVPLPANSAATSESQLESVSCESATMCMAVGNYLDSSGNFQGLLALMLGTSWTAAEAPLPANAGPPAGLAKVNCASAAACLSFGGTASDILVVTGL